MNKISIGKKILLGLILAGFSSTVEAGIIPNNVTSDAVINLGAGQIGIDTPGTYDINNSTGTLNVTTLDDRPIIALSSGNTIINGNVNYVIPTSPSGGGWLFHQGGGTTTVNGKLVMDTTFAPPGGASPYILITTGAATVNITGGAVIKATMTGPNAKTDGVQANAIYARDSSHVNITGDEAYILSVARKPDAITAKGGGNSSVIIDTKKTQVLGNTDYIVNSPSITGSRASMGEGHTIKATFDGADSWWYGDENNVYGILDFTFKNGAEWIYFGQEAVKQVVPVKRITAITLEDGGAINMYDEYVHQLWEQNGIAPLNPEMMTLKHDYVRIGDLRGTGGIFRLDLNDANKAETDMVFIENSTTGGTHFIQAYSQDGFDEISATNTLRFATVAAAAKDKITFADSKNIYNESLYDYNLLIGSSDYDASDPENAVYNSKVVLRPTTSPVDVNDLDTQYAGGKNWFIYGVEKKQSVGSIGITTSADANYDTLTQMDRLNKRQGEARYLTDNNGIWVRMQRGSKGREDGYSGKYTMGQLGYDKINAKGDRRFGLALDYTTGNTNFVGAVGTDKQTRRGIMLYDTWTGDKGHYLDLTLRYSKLNNDTGVYNQVGQQYAGEYSNWGIALSGEYGKKTDLQKGWYVEPQGQLQIMRLNGVDYTQGTKMHTSIDAATSILGRLGFRLGREVAPQSMFYFKADLLHEFGNGQTVNMTDGFNRVSYTAGDNSTWYDIGIGVDHKISDKTYVFVDLEKDLGGHREKTWQINAGARWAF